MIDSNPKRSDEPVWWGLFGAGGSWFAMITPITILLFGILIPMGAFDGQAISYERMSETVTSFFGALFTIGTLSLPIWHAMHRVHHGMHDLQIHTGKKGKIACYGFAMAVSVLSFLLIFAV